MPAVFAMLVTMAVVAVAAPVLAEGAYAQTAATISAVGSPDDDGRYGTGKIIAITVEFSRDVEVEGSPSLALATSPVERSAAYRDGTDGDRTIEFWYTVQPGDMAADLGYAGTDALALNGGAIRDTDGNDADLELPLLNSASSLNGSKSIVIDTSMRPVLAALDDPAVNGSNGLRLDAPERIAAITTESDGKTYAAVTSRLHPTSAYPAYYGIQLIQVNDDGTLEAIDSANHTTISLLRNVNGIDMFEMNGGTPYAITANTDTDSLTLFRIDGGMLVLNGSIRNDGGNATQLDGVNDVASFKMGGGAYAISATNWREGARDGAVGVFYIDGNGTIVPRASLDANEASLLNGTERIETFESSNGNGTVYALAVSAHTDDVVLLSINDEGRDLRYVGAASLDSSYAMGDGDNPHDVATFSDGDTRYAMASTWTSSTAHLMTVDESTGRIVTIDDDVSGSYRNARSIEAFEMGGANYALLPGRWSDNVEMFRISAGSTVEGAGLLGIAPGRALDGPFDVAVASAGDGMYALVASKDSHGVQPIRLLPTSVVGVDSSMPAGTYTTGDKINITVTFSDNVTVSAPSPRLLLETGNSEEGVAEYADGSGTSQLMFQYAVRQGDLVSNLDYAGTGALGTRGAITEARGAGAVDLSLSMPGSKGSLSNSSSVNIQTPLEIVSVGSPDDDGRYGTGKIIAITVEFSRDVEVEGSPSLALATSPVERSAAYRDGTDGDRTIEFWYTVQPGDMAADLGYAGTDALALNGGAIRDTDGNDADLELPLLNSASSLNGSKSIVIDTSMRPVLAALDDPAVNGSNGLRLDAPERIAAITTESDGKTYAAVTSRLHPTSAYPAYYGIQLIQVNDDGTLEAIDSANHTTISLLRNVNGIDMFEMNGGTPYAITANTDTDSLTLFRIDGGMLVLNGSIRNDGGNATQLDGVNDVASFKMGGGAYAISATNWREGARDGAVGVFYIDGNGTIVPRASLDANEASLLNGTERIETFESSNGNGTVYALAVSAHTDDVVLLSINDEGRDLRYVGAASLDSSYAMGDGDNPHDVATFSDGDTRYAMASTWTSSTAHLMTVDESTGRIVTIDDDVSGSYRNARSIEAFEMGGANYALLPGRWSDNVEMFRISAGSTVEGAGLLGIAPGRALDGPFDVAVASAGDGMYALVASKDSHGVQPIRLLPTSVVGVDSSMPAGTYTTGDKINITVTFSDNVTVSAPSPRLLLETGNSEEGVAEYADGSGTSQLMFQYAVRQGDLVSNLDYAGTGALGTRGMITGIEDAPAVLELPSNGDSASLAGSAAIAIDAVPPTVMSVTSPNADAMYGEDAMISITVAFSEDVIVRGTPQIELEMDNANRNASYASGTGSAMLVFQYTVRAGDMASDLNYAGTDALTLNGGMIQDALDNDAVLTLPAVDAGESLAGSKNIIIDAPARTPGGGGEPPVVDPSVPALATASAVFTDTTEVTITYSVPLDKPDDYVGNAYGNVTLGSSVERMPVSEAGLGTKRHTVEFAGTAVTRSQTGMIMLNTVLEGQDGSDAYVFNGTSVPVAAAGTSADVYVALEDERDVFKTIAKDGFRRTVNTTMAGDGARTAINVTALDPESLQSRGTVSFPEDDSVEMISSFAEVSFPPNVTAMNVPADGRLDLYVENAREPTPEQAAEALGPEYGTDAAVHRIVEVGDPDMHIVFDRPVRIAITGQAGGLAYYMNNTDNSIVPITVMCAEDATGAVHAQLGGSGECQIETGGDKIIYTYHLTRFGVAQLSEAPRVSAVTSPDADETYGVGAMINITVAFTENIAVTGTPALELETGDTDQSAVYASAGSDTIMFRYEVQQGDSSADLDYAGTDALSLNGGTVRDVDGNDADLALPAPGAAGSLSHSSNIVIDTAVPAGMTNSAVGTMTATILPAAAPPPDAGGPVTQPTVVATPPSLPFGTGGGSGGGGGGGGTRLSPGDGSGSIILYAASWDCNEGTIQITANAGISPEISVLSSAGTIVASMSDGPHPTGRTVYEASLPEDSILSIRATVVEGRTMSTASETVRTNDQCTGETVFRAYGAPTAAPSPADRDPSDDSAAAERPDMPADQRQPSDDSAAAERPDMPADERQQIVIPPPPPDPDEMRQDADADGETAPPATTTTAEPRTTTAADDDDGGCLIATAAYGTEITPQVQHLREVRDSTLLSTESGRAFMAAFGTAYYAFSPHVADLEREHPAFRQAVAALVAPMLLALQVVDSAEPGSEHSVVAYGALAISLVAGMYVAAPAAGAWYAVRVWRGRSARAPSS